MIPSEEAVLRLLDFVLDCRNVMVHVTVPDDVCSRAKLLFALYLMVCSTGAGDPAGVGRLHVAVRFQARSEDCSQAAAVRCPLS